jgi:hypothetical protein
MSILNTSHYCGVTTPTNHSAVKTPTCYGKQLNPLTKAHAIFQAVSRLPFTVEARVQSRASACEIRGEGSGTGTEHFSFVLYDYMNAL